MVGLLLAFLKSKVGGFITYVKQLSDVQSKENSTDSPHVPLSSSASCLKSLLSSSHFRAKDSDLNRFSFLSDKKTKKKNNWEVKRRHHPQNIHHITLLFAILSFVINTSNRGSSLKIACGYAKNILTAVLAVLAGKNRNLYLSHWLHPNRVDQQLFSKWRSKQAAGLLARPPPPCSWGQTVKICRRRPHAWDPVVPVNIWSLQQRTLWFFSCPLLYQTVASCLFFFFLILLCECLQGK